MKPLHTHIAAFCTLMLFACTALLPASVKTGTGGDILCVRGLQNDSIVMAGTSRNGIYRTVDGGKNWMSTGLREGSAGVLTPDPRNPLHCYAGTDHGLFATSDGGATWWAVDSALHPSSLVASLSGMRVLLAADGAVVRRTTDDGKSWSTIEALSLYGIGLLANARVDSGAYFFAACDSVIFMTSEKNQALWTKLPALPRVGSQRVRITSLVCDTLSRDGMHLDAGTTSGVFTYSFAAREWRRLQNGLPDGKTGALGLIVYDTTVASRSYSLCVSMLRDTATLSSHSGVYKLSSVSGVINPASAWNLIDDEQADVRDCFMPDRGPNRAKLYLATSDGLRISYDGGTTWTRIALEVYPIASIVSRSLNAGVVGNRATTRVSVQIANRGERTLTVRVRGMQDTENFTLLASDSLNIPWGASGELQVQFNPRCFGKFMSRLLIETNDPQCAWAAVSITGYSTGCAVQNTTVVIDRVHGGLETDAYAALTAAFKLAGITVIDSLPSVLTPKIATFILPGPIRAYSDSECSILARSVSAGACIVAFGNADDSSHSVLNRMFGSSFWKNNAKTELSIRFGTAHITSPRGSIAAARSFGLRSAPYLAHTDTLGFMLPTEVIVAGTNADTLCAVDGVTRSDVSGVQSGTRAVLGAVARIGSGKVIAMGDTRVWSTLTADDAHGLWDADNFATALSIVETVENGEVIYPAKTAKESYRLFSIPYALTDNSVASVFHSLGNPNPYEWRLFGAWNELTGTYVEYPSTSVMTIDRGKAYWLITKAEHDVTPGTADYSLIPDPFTMTLKPGFTMIGNPFPFPIDWRKSAAASNVEAKLWGYTGTEFVSTYVMQPFEGYFVYNPSDIEKVVRVYPEPVASKGLAKIGSYSKPIDRAGSTGQSAGEWSLRVQASDGTASDGENYCGMLRASIDGRDVNDWTEPPLPPGRFVSFRFIGSGTKALASDYRTVSAEGAFWNCEIRASEAGAHIRLDLTPEMQLPAGYSVYILDYSEERMVDCSGTGVYEFRMHDGEQARALRIIAGQQQFIERNSDGVPMTPLAYALEQNFPNPWNPTTTIRYTLAHSSDIRLEIFNLLGQRIRTLVHGVQALGTYAQEWDGRDDGGASVASGVYIYRISTPAFSQSKRMVLLR